jgi:hypothetical protein
MECRSLLLATVVFAIPGHALLAGEASAPPRPRTYTAPPFAGWAGHTVEALLYNPPVDEVPWRDAGTTEVRTRKIEPRFGLCGSGLPDGAFVVRYRIEAGDKALHEDKAEVTVVNGWFEKDIALATKLPQATHVAYEVLEGTHAVAKGRVALVWSRFRGRLRYLDGAWRSSYIALFPNGFNSLRSFYIPVGDDGTFDALVPSRVYSVMNVNGAGYSYDAMERWAWDYDLHRDREDVFTLGRTELYSMHAFDIKGPIPTIFVAFRPTALSRVQAFDANGDGWVRDDERKTMEAAMGVSPTVIGPELEAKDVRVWLNGNEERVVQFTKVPEYDGAFWQIQYLLQICPDPRPARGVWHEIKVEVRSTERVRGGEMIDFGQGSVGFRRP